MGDENRLRDALRASEPTTSRCLNCGAPLAGAFCSACGQRDIPPYPSVRELAGEALSEFSGWDGRVASSVRALILRPGMLTHEFLEGRRARYVSPLRLYLTVSVIYFLLAAAAPNLTLDSGKTLFLGLRVGPTSTDSSAAQSRPERVANAAGGALENQQALKPAEMQAALDDIARAPAVMQPFLRRAVTDPAGFKRGIVQTMPKMLFALLPVFAAIVALFYRGRKYPEHLYFAIHLQAFTFVALGLTALAKFTRIPVLAMLASAVAVIWIPTYATLAFRRVYGGSLVGTVAKEIGIAAIYLVTWIAAFILMIYWVSVAT
jgi:uncharacterized protein DUF3667